MTYVCDFTYSPENLENHVHDATEFILSIHQILSSQTDLTPDNEIVNKTLTMLVHRLQDWENDKVLTLSDLDHLPRNIMTTLPELCSKAECSMEKWWALRILSGKKTVEEFWYLDHYRALVAAERRLLHPLNASTVVFLGSGPLPLTAILLAKAIPHLNVICVDSDPIACELSTEIFKKYQLTDRTKVVHCFADQFRYTDANLVICASLLQSSDIFCLLHRADIPNVLSRDVEGLYHFLYRPSVKPHEKQYREICKTHLNSEYINVSRMYERVSS